MKCCLNCTGGKRHPGCHDKCDTYLTEKAAEDKRKEIIRKAKLTEAMTISKDKHYAKKGMDIYNISRRH